MPLGPPGCKRPSQPPPSPLVYRTAPAPIGADQIPDVPPRFPTPNHAAVPMGPLLRPIVAAPSSFRIEGEGDADRPKQLPPHQRYHPFHRPKRRCRSQGRARPPNQSNRFTVYGPCLSSCSRNAPARPKDSFTRSAGSPAPSNKLRRVDDPLPPRSRIGRNRCASESE